MTSFSFTPRHPPNSVSMRLISSCVVISLLLITYLVYCAPSDRPSLDEQGLEQRSASQTSTSPPVNNSLSTSSWPDRPYALPLTDDFDLNIITASSYTRRPLPAITIIQDFIRDFSENLEHACPPPALAPKEAGQSLYDTESFTRWHIVEYVLPITSQKAPTVIVLAALAQLYKEVARHGPPADARALILGRKKPGLKKNSPFNSLVLAISPL